MKKRHLIIPMVGLFLLGAAGAAIFSNTNYAQVRADDAATVMDPGVTSVEIYNDFYAHVNYTTDPFSVDGFTFAYLKINGTQTWSENLPAIKQFNLHLQNATSPYTFEWFANTGLCYARAIYPQGDVVTIDTKLTVNEGESKALTVTASGEVTFGTSNANVATVDSNGVVTGVSAGTTTITATCGSATATCVVTVKAAGTVETYEIASFIDWYGDNYCKVNWSNSSLKLSDEIDYTKYDSTDGTYTYTGATFKDNWVGGSALFVGNDIYSHHSSLTYLLVTFYNASDEIVGYAQYGTAPSADTIALQATAEVKVTKTIELTATTNAEEVTWSSSDTSIATVSGTGKTATITGVALGEAVITAELQNGNSASCTVTVVADEAVKLDAPVGLVMNLIGDGGYIVAFAPVTNASSYKAEFYDAGTTVLVGSHTIANGGALNPAAANLVPGNAYNVRIVSVGDGTNYVDSDPSAIVNVNNGKRAGESTYIYHTGESYANYFNNLDMCDSTGATMRVTEALWNDATAMYDNLFYAERMNLKNKTTQAATNAIERYEYILGKYSESDYSYLKDFLQLNVTRPSGANYAFGIFENNTAIIVISCIALVSFAGVAVALNLKKRKHNA